MYNELLLHKPYIDNETAQNLSPELRKIWAETNECRTEMAEILLKTIQSPKRGIHIYGTYLTVISYLLAKASKYNNPFNISLDDFLKDGIDKDILSVAYEIPIGDVWESLLQLLKKYPTNIFALNVHLRDLNDANSTPEGIANLAIKLLDIAPGDNIAELCCGTGLVIRSIKDSFPSVNATGYDKNQYDIAVAKACNEFSDKKISFFRHDIFTLVNDGNRLSTYNKIFSNYPFGMRLRDLGVGKKYLETLSLRVPSISKATSSDWLYNMLMTELLKENGKAVGIMTNGSTWNLIDAPIRKYFVENGLIECVIALPARLFGNSAIATSMVVFSHRNTGVRLVDASSQFKEGRRTNELTVNNVNTILDMITTDSEKSCFITTESLRQNDYVLNTNRYITNSNSIKDGVSFDTVIKRITRGAPLNANQLDKISSAVPTDMQYLMLSNIKNGLIDVNLPYLTEIDKKNEKYCLSNHCLIMSKNGYPYKIAVAEVKEGQRIMANGNLYIIELDEEMVDPYYLAAFFNSENGTAALKSITVGAAIPNIGVEQLKKLTIPLPPIEKQKVISDRYKESRDEIEMLQLKMAKALNRMIHVFEEGS